jgi:hypothetical protein
MKNHQSVRLFRQTATAAATTAAAGQPKLLCYVQPGRVSSFCLQ